MHTAHARLAAYVAAHVAPVRYTLRPPIARRARLGKGRAMAALLAHKSPTARTAWLAANYARHLAGLPLLWPAPVCNGRPR